GATFTEAGLTAFSPGSHTTIDADLLLDAPTAAHTLRLNGTTSWSAGSIDIQDAGIVENAGTLNITGTVSVSTFFSGGAGGRLALRVLAGGLTGAAGAALALAGPLARRGGPLAGGGAAAGPAGAGGRAQR